MSARTKLNVAVLNGCLFVAALVGAICDSWTIFGLIAVVLVVGEYHGGAIRTTPGPRRSRRR